MKERVYREFGPRLDTYSGTSQIGKQFFEGHEHDRDKIRTCNNDRADPARPANKPGGMTAAEAIGASTGPVNDQAVRLQDLV